MSGGEAPVKRSPGSVAKKSPQASPPRPSQQRPAKESPLSGSDGRRKTLDPATARKGKSGSSSDSQTPEPSPVSVVCMVYGV